MGSSFFPLSKGHRDKKLYRCNLSCYLLKIYSGKISHIHPDGFPNLYIIIFPVNICPKFLIGGDGIGDQMFSGYSAFFVVGVGQVSRMALVGLVAGQSP